MTGRSFLVKARVVKLVFPANWVKSSAGLWMASLLLGGMLLAPVFGQEAPQGKTPLEAVMRQMGVTFKSLGTDLKQPQDEAKGDYLKLVQALREESVKSRDLAPKAAALLPADQQPAFVEAYRKDMDKFIASVDVLGAAVQEGRWDDARKTLDDLKQQMGDGHRAYRAKKGGGLPPGPAASIPAPSSDSAPAPAPAS